MTGQGQFSDFACQAETAFQDAVCEARARSIAPAEVETALMRLGFRQVTATADSHVLAAPNGRQATLPTRAPIGMAPLLAALRAAAGMDDAAA